MNVTLQTKLTTLPAGPGVYFHKSASGEIIYIGKAAVLKNRVRQYFQTSRNRDNKTMALVSEIADTDWVETDSEIDALFLESEMVKRYMPRYNILLRDDKSQSYVRIDMKNEWPVVSFTRNPADDGAEYIGPFYNGAALKKALRYLRRIFPYLINPMEASSSKLEAQIGLNPSYREGSASYKANLAKLLSYIKGNRTALTRELEQDMKNAASDQRFEDAARLRNRLRAMQELQRRVMFGDSEFLDISKDQALSDLAQLLGIDDILRRIEGYDISHQSGSDVVGSMVVFTNGVSARSEYRKFKMSKQSNDDTGNIYETIYRRLSPQNLKRWGNPDLLLIDGGSGQLNAAIAAQSARATNFPLIAVAKREEEIIIARSGSHVDVTKLESMQLPLGVTLTKNLDHIILNLHAGQRNASSHSKNLGSGATQSPYMDVVKLFQRIRDEAHRFAVSYHSVLKRTRQTKGQLHDIAGIGPKTRQLLLRRLGSVQAIEKASLEELEAAIGQSKAKLVRQYFDTNRR